MTRAAMPQPRLLMLTDGRRIVQRDLAGARRWLASHPGWRCLQPDVIREAEEVDAAAEIERRRAMGLDEVDA